MSVKILIIDDDISIGNLEQEVLEQTGYQVLRAYSGTEAVLLLKSCRPDLILLDLMLPGLSGEEVLPQIQNIPVIVVSAKTAVQTKVEVNRNECSFRFYPRHCALGDSGDPAGDFCSQSRRKG